MRVALPRRASAAVLTAAAAVLLLGACGGSNPSPGSAAPTGGGNSFAAYLQCLRDNGVTNLPSVGPSGFRRGARPSGFPTARPTARPSTGTGRRFPGGRLAGPPAGVDAGTWQKAQQACAAVRPTGRPGGFGGQRRPDGAYRNCLSDHGVGPGQENGTDPKTAAARAACKVLSPAPTASPAG